MDLVSSYTDFVKFREEFLRRWGREREFGSGLYLHWRICDEHDFARGDRGSSREEDDVV
jgi:hypothetical protein